MRRLARVLGACATLAFAGLELGACAHAGYPVERTIEGTRVAGIWVPPSSYEHYVRAELALTQGRPDDALTELALARAGGYSDLHLDLREVEAISASGDAARARRNLDRLAHAQPESAAILAMSATLHERAEERLVAEEELVRASALAPATREYAVRAARLRLARGDRPGALALLTGVLDRGGLGAEDRDADRVLLELALTEGDGVLAARVASAIAARGDRPLRSTLVAAARTALVDGRPALAASLLDPLPPEPGERRLRIELAVALRRRDAAERGLVSPTDGLDELACDALTWSELGAHDRAIELLRDLSLRDQSPRLELALASALVARNTPRDRDEAAALLASATPGTSLAPIERALVGSLLASYGEPVRAQSFSGAVTEGAITPAPPPSGRALRSSLLACGLPSPLP